MKTLQAVLIAVVVLAMFDTCLGNDCKQLSFQRVQCPGTDAATVSSSLCKQAGCWWCNNDIEPICTQGYACRSTAVRDCWKGEPGMENAKDCRVEYGCSWCEFATDFKCREEIPTDVQLTCSRPIDELPLCEEGITESLCLDVGCWWCPKVLDYYDGRCVRGIACSMPGKVDCWPADWGPPNSPDCRRKLGCTWCPESEIKCVREYMEPMPGVDQCDKPASERTSCAVSGPDKRTNCAKEGCWWCAGGIAPKCIRGKACARSFKVDCWPASNSDTPNKEDCRVKYGCSWCPSEEAGVPECLVDTDECDRSMDDVDPCLEEGDTNDRKTCVNKGCWWCGNNFPAKRCSRGKPCEQYPKENCWPDDTDPNEKDCRKKYRCSWCPDETPNCVRPQGICYYKQALSCYPIKDPEISKDDCLADSDCFYCPLPSERDVKCVRPMCPDGEVVRKSGLGCCKEEEEEVSASASSTDRIVGGRDAEEAEWAWQGMLIIDGSFVCGSVLITADYSLCAAHCADVIDDETTNMVRYGFIDRQNLGANVQETTFGSYMIHPNYTGVIGEPDIMIIMHDDTLTLNTYVNVISLPRGEMSPAGMTCFITGWGITGDGFTSDILQEVAVDIISPSACMDVYDDIMDDDNIDEFVCFGRETGGAGSCSGDSGGPGVCQRCENCQFILVGITAFGVDCVSAPAQFPSVYTSVLAFEDWIRMIVPGLPGDGDYNCDFY